MQDDWLRIFSYFCVRLVHLVSQNEAPARLVKEGVIALGSFAHGIIHFVCLVTSRLHAILIVKSSLKINVYYL
jgi:hypothetical protein